MYVSTENTDVADLGMLQLSDSFFPTGMYTTSSGLEAIFYGGKKKMSADELRDLIMVFIESQIGPADCTALCNAYDHAAKPNLEGLLEVDRTIFSMKLVQEVRSASARSGTQLLRCVHFFAKNNSIVGQYLEAIKAGTAFGAYPVALAVAAHALAIPKRRAGVMMLYSFSVSVVGAALRLGILQHFDGQKVLDELKPSISRTVDLSIDRPLEGIWQFAPQVDIVQIDHEKMSSKMFIT